MARPSQCSHSTMTAPISSLARALHLLRVELAQTRPGVGQAKPARAQVSAQAQRESAPNAATAIGALRGKLRAARSQPGGLTRGKALRLFVEAALLDELGGALQLDPAFADLVERTCQAIEQDAGNAALLSSAMQELEALA